jgi:hypothetical protein
MNYLQIQKREEKAIYSRVGFAAIAMIDDSFSNGVKGDIIHD